MIWFKICMKIVRKLTYSGVLVSGAPKKTNNVVFFAEKLTLLFFLVKN